MKKILTFLILVSSIAAVAQQPAVQDTTRRDSSRRRPTPPAVGTITPTRETPAHDPVMIKEKNTWYLFTTGNGVQ
jgi:hypothetical protein